MDAFFGQLGCTPSISKCEARDVYKLLSNGCDAEGKPGGVDGLPVAVVGGDADWDGLFTDPLRQIVIVLRNNNKKSHTSKNNPSGTLRKRAGKFFSTTRPELLSAVP